MSAYQAGLASQDDLVAARRADLERELRSDTRCGPETEPTKKQNSGCRILKSTGKFDFSLFVLNLLDSTKAQRWTVQ